MKKLWLIIVFVLLALTLSAQKKSNYEKYWQAREDSIKKSQAVNTESQVQRVDQEDTLQAIVDTIVQQNPDVQVNYFEYDPFYYSYNLGRFYHGGLNYWMYTDPWFYNNYWTMGMYDWNWEMGFMGNSFWNPWYYDNYGFGYGGGYGWWYSNWTPWRYNHWNHDNNWNHNNNWYTHNYNNGGGSGYNGNHGYGHTLKEIPSNINKHITSVQPQNKALYQSSRRSYTPSYNNPRMSTRPAYNNSRVTTGSIDRRVQTGSYSQSRAYSQSNTQRSVAPNTQRSIQSRAYSVPSRGSVSQSQSRSYSNSNSYSNSRSSNYSSGSSNYSSGSSSRSSGSYSSGGGGSSRSSGGGGSGRR